MVIGSGTTTVPHRGPETKVGMENIETCTTLRVSELRNVALVLVYLLM